MIVDYAHSPESLKAVYEAIKPAVKNRLIRYWAGQATGIRLTGQKAELWLTNSLISCRDQRRSVFRRSGSNYGSSAERDQGEKNGREFV